MKHLKSLGVIIGALVLFRIVSKVIVIFERLIHYGPMYMELDLYSTNTLIAKQIGVFFSINSIAMDLIAFLILWIIFLKFGGLIKYVKLNKTYKIGKIKFIIPAVLGAMFVGGILSNMAVSVFGTNQVTNIIFNHMFRTPLGVLQAVIIAPIVEETLMRGVVFNYLRKNYRLGVAIVVQAIVFGVFHGNVAQGFNAFVGGVIFAIIYVYTDSLWGDITAHMMNNGIWALINVLTIYGYKDIANIISGLLAIGMIVGLVIAIRYYIKYVHKDMKSKDIIFVK